ncbi:hypothetical protein KSP40_PGU003191 [Platanthera guangdongensis]|uniref:F1F0-ATPase inhibitor protein n=1 Tax=Platanthera guangdongensis TaxID=2320717 RepID=A0ABR2M6V7_9ASPA
MAVRTASRYFVRRLSSSGKVLAEEEKAAENVYIKKIEQEKLEKLARKGPTPGDQAASGTLAAADAVRSSPAQQESSTAGMSTDRHRNYAVLVGTLTGLSALGWYLLTRPKKSEELSN